MSQLQDRQEKTDSLNRATALELVERIQQIAQANETTNLTAALGRVADDFGVSPQAIRGRISKDINAQKAYDALAVTFRKRKDEKYQAALAREKLELAAQNKNGNDSQPANAEPGQTGRTAQTSTEGEVPKTETVSTSEPLDQGRKTGITSPSSLAQLASEYVAQTGVRKRKRKEEREEEGLDETPRSARPFPWGALIVVGCVIVATLAVGAIIHYLNKRSEKQPKEVEPQAVIVDVEKMKQEKYEEYLKEQGFV